MCTGWSHIILGIFTYSIFNAKSQQAEQINRVTNYFFAAATGIFLVVCVLTFVVVFKYRRKEHVESSPGKVLPRWWEIPMIAIPALLVGLFLYLTVTTMYRVLPDRRAGPPDVIVTGHQWWWEVQYPGQRVVTANEIHVPVGKKLFILLRSADVIHDWWIPQFGNKMDMVPGQDNYIWLMVTEQGTYTGGCSEFCGAQHAGMLLRVIAEPEAAFASWLNHQGAPAAASLDTGTTTGRQLFVSSSCGNCHQIAGTSAVGHAGPDLTHLGSRSTLLSGLVKNDSETLSRWIADPQTIKPGANMPKFLLDNRSIQSITSYLLSLK
jgi:cytochrome c oxidase subunit 2